MFDYFRLIIFMRRVINLAESGKQTTEEHDFDKNIAVMFNLLLESQYITYDLIITLHVLYLRICLGHNISLSSFIQKKIYVGIEAAVHRSSSK